MRHNSKGIISREAFQDSDGKYSNENFIHWNDQLQQEFFLTNEKQYFSEFKKRKLVHLVKSDVQCCVSLNSLPHCLPHFSILKNVPILNIYLASVVNGTSWQKLLRNLDPITRTRMYNQLLKIINERREQKKLIEESQLFKKKKERKIKINCLEFKTKKGRDVSSWRPEKIVLTQESKKEERATSQKGKK